MPSVTFSGGYQSNRPIEVTERARKYLASMPPAISGQSGHSQIFKAAVALVNGFALEPEAAFALLCEYNSRSVPEFRERDLRHKIESAIKVQHDKPRGHLLGGESGPPRHTAGFRFHSKPRPRPMIDPATTCERFLAGYRCTEGDLLWASPVPIFGKPGAKDALLLLRHLYNPGERINFVFAFSRSQQKDGSAKASPIGKGETVERDELIARWETSGVPQSDGGAWLRMNPVDSIGIADANVTAHRFGLIEFDAIPFELQLSLVARLPLPIAAVLTSGGRSIHAWVRLDAQNADEYRRQTSEMLKLLEPLTADPKNGNPSRLSRLPGAVRKIGASGDGVQQLVYLNPQPSNNTQIAES